MIGYISIAFFVVMVIRSIWVSQQVEEYQFKCLHYLAMNPELPPSVAVELADLWPKQWLYWDWIHWDFTRYVVHQDHYEDMTEYFDSQLARENLDITTIQKEISEVERQLTAKAAVDKAGS
jgi:hypothetical protein